MAARTDVLLPIVVEEVQKVLVVPVRGSRGPRAFKTAGESVQAFACVERACGLEEAHL